MNIKIIALTALLFFAAFAKAQKCKKNLLISFYNVENLFDTIHNPHKLDVEFTPQGRKHWTSKRYNDKIEKVSRVIASYDPHKLPDITGLCEIENRSVVEDLIKTKNLKKGKYRIVHYESPDIRGIDNALIYRKKKMKLIFSHAYHVRMKDNKRFKTRDIIYAKFYVKKAKDTLHVLVNHWPSRRGGELKSRPKRAAAARVARHIVDSLINTGTNPKIFIMGDLNDEPVNYAVEKVLRAYNPDTVFGDTSLLNLCYRTKLKHSGSYYYWRTQEWDMIDNMIVTGNFFTAQKGLILKDKDVKLFKPDWLLYTNKKGVKSPARTYGRYYYGGYSDHLSIYTRIYFKCKKKK